MALSFEMTPNWYAVCPQCQERHERDDVACLVCKRPHLVYYRETYDPPKEDILGASSLRCRYEGTNLYGFRCKKCNGPIPMGCIAGFVEKRAYLMSFLVGLVAGVAAFALLYGLGDRFFTGKIAVAFRNAAIVVGLSIYLYVHRYWKIHHGKQWLRWSNE